MGRVEDGRVSLEMQVSSNKLDEFVFIAYDVGNCVCALDELHHYYSVEFVSPFLTLGSLIVRSGYTIRITGLNT